MVDESVAKTVVCLIGVELSECCAVTSVSGTVAALISSILLLSLGLLDF